MKASKLIQAIANLIKNHGDIDVYYWSDGTGESTYVPVGQIKVIEGIIEDQQEPVITLDMDWNEERAEEAKE